jgi:hypothetical protein
VQRLQKRQATPDVWTPFSKEVSSPWRDYQKSLKLNQAGHGLVVHAKNAAFAEGILKEIRGYGKEKLSNVTSYSHKIWSGCKEPSTTMGPSSSHSGYVLGVRPRIQYLLSSAVRTNFTSVNNFMI